MVGGRVKTCLSLRLLWDAEKLVGHLLKVCLLIASRRVAKLIACAGIRTTHVMHCLQPCTPAHLDWSLPAHRRGTLRGMDAA
ncbi:hypothetical protein XHV734_0949 [Xanthomonas hortorum pv. vitians]|nr:hypothetical protein XHV734_0949 [Xanthomonas hortorum pv. vitians]